MYSMGVPEKKLQYTSVIGEFVLINYYLTRYFQKRLRQYLLLAPYSLMSNFLNDPKGIWNVKIWFLG